MITYFAHSCHCLYIWGSLRLATISYSWYSSIDNNKINYGLYLQRCVECDGSNMTDDCVTRGGTADGAGIPDADMVIYVSTLPCDSPYTIAFAGACQLESKYDRYNSNLPLLSYQHNDHYIYMDVPCE